ncbi:phospholipase [Aliidiomarina minuta]|uniref:TVP38/TMEM64 family membrane protein n=2 Tax=Aliidiomarina minuta TaxID=880057 RepID=A0A432W474_9GAMM|nr:phospholipase [Aliidiomarina minuta]
MIDAEVIEPEQLRQLLDDFAADANPIVLLITVILTYIIALLLMFPLTLLVVATGILFGPWWGLLYAILGTLSSSACSYWIGRHLGKDTLTRYQGRLLRKTSSYMTRRTINSMIIINLLPVAPFTMTNLMGGAMGMPFLRYMLGSAIGIIPGLAAVTLLGAQLTRLLLAEENREIAIALGTILAALALLFVIHLVYRRKQKSKST